MYGIYHGNLINFELISAQLIIVLSLRYMCIILYVVGPGQNSSLQLHVQRGNCTHWNHLDVS